MAPSWRLVAQPWWGQLPPVDRRERKEHHRAGIEAQQKEPDCKVAALAGDDRRLYGARRCTRRRQLCGRRLAGKQCRYHAAEKECHHRHEVGKSVTGPKVKNGTLMAGDFMAGQLPAGPQGPKRETWASRARRVCQGPAGVSGWQRVPESARPCSARLDQREHGDLSGRQEGARRRVHNVRFRLRGRLLSCFKE